MFNRRSLVDYYREITEKVKNDILREEDKIIIGTSTKDLSEYYFDKYAFILIEIDEDDELSYEFEKFIQHISANQRDEFYREQGDLELQAQRINLEIPIKENDRIREITELQASTYFTDSSERELRYSCDKVTTSILIKGYGINILEDSIPDYIDKKIENIQKIIGYKNKDIENENNKLKNLIFNFVEERKKQIKEDDKKMFALAKKIKIKLKSKKDELPKKIDISKKPIIKKIKPSSQEPEEYILDSEKVEGILDIVNNQGLQFEKTPKTYKDIDEEGLRDISLVGLNSVFESSATGETFSKKGKSDIYLNIDKGNILVFECKIWGGKVLYQKTINQLRGYVSWRHNYAIMITFVKNKNFSKDNKSVTGLCFLETQLCYYDYFCKK